MYKQMNGYSQGDVLKYGGGRRSLSGPIEYMSVK